MTSLTQSIHQKSAQEAADLVWRFREGEHLSAAELRQILQATREHHFCGHDPAFLRSVSQQLREQCSPCEACPGDEELIERAREENDKALQGNETAAHTSGQAA